MFEPFFSNANSCILNIDATEIQKIGQTHTNTTVNISHLGILSLWERAVLSVDTLLLNGVSLVHSAVCLNCRVVFAKCQAWPLEWHAVCSLRCTLRTSSSPTTVFSTRPVARIYRLITESRYEDDVAYTARNLVPLGPALKQDFPEVKGSFDSGEVLTQ
jgi:hypothetical protein